MARGGSQEELNLMTADELVKMNPKLASYTPTTRIAYAKFKANLRRNKKAETGADITTLHHEQDDTGKSIKRLQQLLKTNSVTSLPIEEGNEEKGSESIIPSPKTPRVGDAKQETSVDQADSVVADAGQATLIEFSPDQKRFLTKSDSLLDEKEPSLDEPVKKDKPSPTTDRSSPKQKSGKSTPKSSSKTKKAAPKPPSKPATPKSSVHEATATPEAATKANFPVSTPPLSPLPPIPAARAKPESTKSESSTEIKSQDKVLTSAETPSSPTDKTADTRAMSKEVLKKQMIQKQASFSQDDSIPYADEGSDSSARDPVTKPTVAVTQASVDLDELLKEEGDVDFDTAAASDGVEKELSPLPSPTPKPGKGKSVITGQVRTGWL